MEEIQVTELFNIERFEVYTSKYTKNCNYGILFNNTT